MFNAPGMTSRGRMIAGICAILIALLLPIHVECGYPGGRCGHHGAYHQVCKEYELEPLAFYLLEKLLDRDVGFAYSSGDDCR